MTIKIASHFENVITHIREQIEINKELIQQADAVFICGGSNTCLSSTALLVGNIINLFKNEQIDLTTSRIAAAPMTVVNNQVFTNDLMTLVHKIGIPVETKLLHVFDMKNDTSFFQSPLDGSNIINLLKTSTSVIIDDEKYVSTINNCLRYKLNNKEITGTYVQVMRLSSRHWLDHQDEIKVYQNKFSPTGLKVVFIETAKCKRTGIVDLVFHT